MRQARDAKPGGCLAPLSLGVSRFSLFLREQALKLRGADG